MGGDVSFASNATLPPALQGVLDSLDTHGTPVATVVSFVSMATDTRSGGTRLAQIKAVTPGYPFYGTIVTSPAGQWERLQQGPYAIVDPALLIALDANVGDSLAIGYMKFEIIGAVKSMAGQSDASLVMAPRVFLPRALRAGDPAPRVRQPRVVRVAREAAADGRQHGMGEAAAARGSSASTSA